MSGTPEERLDRDRLDDDLFKILEDHLNGVGRGILRARLEDLCNDEKQGGKDALTLYKEAHISKANAEKLITLLCVSKEFKEPDTLFGWVKALSQKDYGHRHLEDFYHLLQEVKPRKSWTVPLFLATLGTMIGSIYLSVMPEQLRAFEALIAKAAVIIAQFLQTTFSILKNIPLVLLIYSVLCIPVQAYHSIVHDSFRSLPKRLQKWLTGTLPPVLSLISYALAYAAQGVFTPLAVGFFIASSFVGVANSLFNFHHLKPIGDEPLKTAALETRLDYLRQKERRARTAKTIGVNLVASILTSITVILWGILPPSFLIMVGSILFINLVGFTKSAMLGHIHTKGAEKLQKELREISRDNEITAPKATQRQTFETNTANSLDKVLEKLNEAEKTNQALAEQNQRLDERLEAIEKQTAATANWQSNTLNRATFGWFGTPPDDSQHTAARTTSSASLF
ncbi:MAG: hypothetical protein K0U37_02575 [Gammaproteobacteria bacterium]|nr:hypothetical protein [Gammaproteobacteria bacterium]